MISSIGKCQKSIIVILFAIMFIIPSCRERMTDMLNPDSLTTNTLRERSFLEQMVTIWEGINTSYVFWEIDTVDWDARRDKMYKWAENMDATMTAGKPVDFYTTQLSFASLFTGLIDHHMTIRIKIPYEDYQAVSKFYTASPGRTEASMRNYVHYEIDFMHGANLLKEMESENEYRVSDFSIAEEDTKEDTFRVISCFIDDDIAYIRFSDYSILAPENHSEEVNDAIFGHFARIKEKKDKNKLRAIILDNRGNIGGSLSDLKWVVGLYTADPIVCQYVRTKNGMGRYDYTPETPLIVDPNSQSLYYIGDLGTTKYVVLQDINSVSMGEMTGNAILHLPTGFTIGDCTFGGHGALNAGMYDATWTGPFAYNLKDNCFVYTSTYLARVWDWKKQRFDYLEGKGMEPMLKVVITQDPQQTNKDEQLIRALQYIKDGK